MVSSWAGGIYVLIKGREKLRTHIDITENPAEALLFVASLLVTLSSDGLGYVHATSPRWALYREHRLEYNTNFRLFTSASNRKKNGVANRWYINLLAASSLVVSYACVSVLLIRSDHVTEGEKSIDFSTSGIAFIFLGTGLCGQLVTAILCLRNHETLIKSWNANPLWNTYKLTTIEGSGFEHVPGRCLHPVFDRDSSGGPKRPGKGRRLLWHLRSTKRILAFVWFLALVSCIWPALVLYASDETFDADEWYRVVDGYEFTWNLEIVESRGRHGVWELYFNGHPESDVDGFPLGLQYVVGILFLCLIQALLLTAIHCVELLVNMWRDERVWRKAGRKTGTSATKVAPVVAALTSWQTDFLLILKPLLHWLLGQCMVPEYWNHRYDAQIVSVVMSTSRLVLFAFVMLVLALFATALALWPPRGNQPVAWGHLHTLANLVDDWGELDSRRGKLWWGDKSPENAVVRHAGTSGRDTGVSKIRERSEYAGSADGW